MNKVDFSFIKTFSEQFNCCFSWSFHMVFELSWIQCSYSIKSDDAIRNTNKWIEVIDISRLIFNAIILWINKFWCQEIIGKLFSLKTQEAIISKNFRASSVKYKLYMTPCSTSYTPSGGYGSIFLYMIGKVFSHKINSEEKFLWSGGQ